MGEFYRNSQEDQNGFSERGCTFPWCYTALKGYSPHASSYGEIKVFIKFSNTISQTVCNLYITAVSLFKYYLNSSAI